jgi:WhiB family redox-sensing transcriptional regulator
MITDLPDIVAPPEWTKNARCASPAYDPDDWFPQQGTPDYLEKKERALAVCRRCPVRLQCLRHALDTEDVIWGIRGAQTQHGRSRIRTRLRKLGRRS